MGIDVFEDAVASWLQAEGFFIISNARYGHNHEIDILALKIREKENILIHVEVSCSSNPIGLLGSGSAGNKKDYEILTQEYANKKFFNNEVKERIKKLAGGKEPSQRWFVHGKMKEPRQLQVLHKLGIHTISIAEVVSGIVSHPLNQFSGDKRIKQLLDLMQPMPVIAKK